MPASKLFFFQLGPVHEFISQARSTRDLWSGSYQVSWMAGRVILELERITTAQRLGQADHRDGMSVHVAAAGAPSRRPLGPSPAVATQAQ
jgi:hypothetical protein